MRDAVTIAAMRRGGAQCCPCPPGLCAGNILRRRRGWRELLCVGEYRSLPLSVEEVDVAAAEHLRQRVDAQRHEDGDEDGEKAIGVRHESDTKDANQDDQLQRGVLANHRHGHLVEEIEASRVAPRRISDEQHDALVEGVAREGSDAHVEEEPVKRCDGHVADHREGAQSQPDEHRLRQARDALLVAADDDLDLVVAARAAGAHSPLLVAQRVGMQRRLRDEAVDGRDAE
mmetsp:Transcript_10796/g.25043  ORF Transcript_10796/g.25043 Transcript_10796/m.25043 type:complete len:230 (-) Transcript_10796:1217-1906(-)